MANQRMSDVGFRHSVRIAAGGSRPQDDPVFATIDTVHRMYLRTRSLLQPGTGRSYLALTGPGALAIAASNPHTDARAELIRIRPSDLVVAHQNAARLGPFLEHHLRRVSSADQTLLQAYIRGADYLGLQPEQFARPAAAASLPYDGLIGRLERSYRVVRHAAMRAATVSRIRIHLGGQVEYRELPMLHPDAMLMLAIARMGHTSGMLSIVREQLSAGATGAMPQEQYAQGQLIKQDLEQKLGSYRDDLNGVLAALPNRSLSHSTTGYAIVTDRVIDDEDVAMLLTAGTMSLGKQTREYISGRLRAMDRAAEAHAIEVASHKPLSR